VLADNIAQMNCFFPCLTVASRDKYFGGAFLLLLVVVFYQLPTGNYLGKTKSILPAEWESKRVAIAKRHNQLVGTMLLVLFATLYMLFRVLVRVPSPSHPHVAAFVALFAVGLAEIYVLHRIFQHDRVMCEEQGFMCPHCHKPLHEPRGFINVSGRCPKCRASILS
jgi:hypothetical protein